MKKLIVILMVATSTLALGLEAEEIKLVTVDMVKLYNEYYKTKEANAKIQSSVEKAKEQVEALIKDGQELVGKYKEALEFADNPALTEEARNKAQVEADAKQKEIGEKEHELQQFRFNTERSLRQQQRNYHKLFMDEIKNVVLEVARERDSNLVLDSSGVTAVGLPTVLQADPSWDITEAVLVRINTDAPQN